MSNVNLESVVEEIGLGEYHGPYKGHFAVKLPNPDAIAEFRVGMQDAGFDANGLQMSLTVEQFDDHFLLLFPKSVLTKFSAMDIQYEFPDESKGLVIPPANALRKTQPAVLALGRVFDSLLGDGVQKTYQVCVHSKSIDAVAHVDADEFRFKVTQAEADKFDVAIETLQADGWVKNSVTTDRSNLAKDTDILVKNAVSAWLAEQKLQRRA